MTRNRVRRSFTVEVKGRSRAAVSLQETSKPSSPPPSVLWAGTDLSRELARLAETPATPADAASAEKPVDKVEARRILPSLLIAEPIAVEPEPIPVREARLPRVRRIAERTKAKPDLEASRTPTRSAASRPPALKEKPRVQAAASVATQATVPVAKLRAMKVRGKAEPALKAGERWKLRLPRVCW